MGSKNRIAKEILPIILKDRKPNQCYVEPFVGGGNLIDKVEGFRIGADLNPFIIEALKLIRDNPESLPDHVSEEMYQELKSKKELNGVTGVVGFTMSFGGGSGLLASHATKRMTKKRMSLNSRDVLKTTP